MRKLYIFGLICLMGTIIGFAWAERVNLTAQYPAPSGAYTTINSNIAHIVPSDPSSHSDPEDGMIILDSNDNILKRWDSVSAAWVPLSAPPDSRNVRMGDASVQLVGTTNISAPASEERMGAISGIGGMIVNLDISGSRLWVLFAAPFVRTAAPGQAWVRLYIDGALKRRVYVKLRSDEYIHHAAFHHLEEDLPPGSHTVEIRWQGQGVLQAGSNEEQRRILTVLEITS